MPQQRKIDLASLPDGHAVCAAEVVQVDQGEGKPKRWRLNSGALMRTMVGGFGAAFLVIDLAGVTFQHPEFPMLREHGRQAAATADENAWYVNPVGRWTGTAVDLTGIYGVPLVYTPESPLEEKMSSMIEGAEVAALMKRGHPWQASVSIMGSTADYELVAPGQSAQVNGRTETASADIDAPPLLICRRCVVTEASVCLFGADSNTGAVAASRQSAKPTTNQDTAPMDRLTALLNRHGDKHASRIALALKANKTDDQIAVELSDAAEADHKAALAEKDAKIAKLEADLAASNTKATKLQADLDALKPKEGEETPAVPEAGKGGSSNAAPKSITAGMAQLKAEGSKLTGFDLRKAALSRWPSLRDPKWSAIPHIGAKA